MEYAADTVFVGEFPVLSLSPPFSEESSVIDAQPISYCLPPPSSTSATTTVIDLSCMSDDEDANSPLLSLFPQVSQNHSKPILSLFPQISENPSGPLSLFPQVSENLASSKQFAKNIPTTTTPSSSAAAAPSTDLCLSLSDTTSSTITTLRHSIGSQHSSAKRSLFQESGEEKFVPVKKIKVRKDSSANNPKRPPEVILAAAEGEEEGHWIIKPLTKSDVNGLSRLLLPRKEVKNYVLSFMKEEEQAIICNELCGVDVRVYDMDTKTEHILTLKKWATNSFQLVKAWTTEFVKRRNLKKDDVIWIRWEKNNYRFCFRVNMRNQVDAL